MSEKIETSAVSVKIENLSLSFDETEVLRDINLTIEPGEFFAFLGPSGSGKSTLLRAIAGFGPAPEGRILIGEDDVTSLPPWKRNLGMVFQSYALWPHMTVGMNVAFGLEERKVPKREISERVEAALELVGLTEFADRRPSQLSGGQQQRVALARTIVIEPRVLLLDEPLSNLDANLRIQMRREILELQRQLSLTTIFVTHDQEEANTTSDRIAVLNDGIVQQMGAPMELYDRPANRFVANFLGIANLIDGTVTETEGTVWFKAPDGTSIPLEGVGAGTGENKTIMFRPAKSDHLRRWRSTRGKQTETLRSGSTHGVSGQHHSLRRQRRRTRTAGRRHAPDRARRLRCRRRCGLVPIAGPGAPAAELIS